MSKATYAWRKRHSGQDDQSISLNMSDSKQADGRQTFGYVSPSEIDGLVQQCEREWRDKGLRAIERSAERGNLEATKWLVGHQHGGSWRDRAFDKVREKAEAGDIEAYEFLETNPVNDELVPPMCVKVMGSQPGDEAGDT